MSGDETTRGEPAAVGERADGGQRTDGAAAPTVQLATRPIEEYLAGVRAALSDLPEPEVAEILDDVQAHLADLAAELGGGVDVDALAARLGPPQAYAAELRTAAGYPPAPAATTGTDKTRTGLARLGVVGLVGSTVLVVLGIGAGEPAAVLLGLVVAALGLPVVLIDGPRLPSVAALPEVQRLRADRPASGTGAGSVADFVASLQPAWWVARGVAAAVLLVAVFGDGGAAPALVLALLTVPASIWVGHHTRRDRRWLWLVVPLNALAAVVLVGLLGDAGSGFGGRPSPESGQVVYRGLWQDSEREIRDIRPVDAAGTPLTGIYLFDQDGQPIDTSRAWECDDGNAYDRPTARNDPYPRGTREYDERTGACRLVPPGPLLVAVPAPTTAPATPPGATSSAPATPPPSAPAPLTPAPPTPAQGAPTPSSVVLPPQPAPAPTG